MDLNYLIVRNDKWKDIEKVVTLNEIFWNFVVLNAIEKNIEKYWKSGLIEHYWKNIEKYWYWLNLQ